MAYSLTSRKETTDERKAGIPDAFMSQQIIDGADVFGGVCVLRC